jgi:hypothetical protein
MPPVSPARAPGAFGEALSAAGVLSLVAVVVGGLTAGFFLWYALLESGRLHGSDLSEAALVVSVLLGGVAAVGAWIGYSRYIARRAGTPYAIALRYDAASYLALLLMWSAFFVGGRGSGRSIAVAIAAFLVAKLAGAAFFNATVRDVTITFLVTRIPLIIIAELAAVIISQRAGIHTAVSHNQLLAVWGRWDAVHYLDISTIGYHGTDSAFFPLYPFLMRVLGTVIGSHLVAGLVISNVAFFFGLLFFYKLVEHQYDRNVAHRATFYLAIFPTAIFFSAVYTESLFFCLSVASFYYIRERRWLTAGIIGFFASLSRVEGVLLVIPFAIEWFAVHPDLPQRVGTALKNAVRRPWPNVVRPLLGIALIPAGLLVYMGYLWVLTGDPLYFSHVQTHWGRHFAGPWVAFSHAIHVIATAHADQTIADQLLELVFTVLMVVVFLLGLRRLRPSYLAYMAASIVIPMSTSSLMSMPRFALVLFPMFVMFALWGKRSAFNNAYVAFSLPLLGLFTVLFADWYWVA